MNKNEVHYTNNKDRTNVKSICYKYKMYLKKKIGLNLFIIVQFNACVFLQHI